MHISMHIHSDPGRPIRVSVTSWWVDGGGVHHADLCWLHPLETTGGEKDPWVLLALAYRELASLKSLRSQPPAASQS